MKDKLNTIIQKILNDEFTQVELNYEGFMVEPHQEDVTVMVTWYLGDELSVNMDLAYNSEKEFFETYRINLDKLEMQNKDKFCIDIITQMNKTKNKVIEDIQSTDF